MSRPASSRRLRSWLWRAVWLVAVLLLLEGTTRVFFRVTGQDIEVWRHFTPTRLPRLTVTDPVLGWRLLPSVARNVHTSEFRLVYRTNSHGLRERELDDDGRLRLLFLGDSQTFGEGVEIGRRYSDLLGQKLDVLSINAGVPGYGLNQMVDWFLLEGWRLRPDLVVCAPIEGDLARALYPVGGSAGPPQVVKDPDEHEFVPARWRPAFAALDERLRASYLYSFFGARLKIALLQRRLAERDRRVWRQIFRQGERGERSERAPAPPAPEGAEDGVPVRGVAHAVDPTAPRERLMREITGALLLRLRDGARAARAELLLAPIDDHPLPWLEALAGQHGIAYFDASPALRGQVGVRHAIDPHYTAKGHALLAERLAVGLAPRVALGRRAAGADAEGARWLEAEAQRLRAASRGELPASAFRATWTALDLPAELKAGERRAVRLRITNAGDASWPAGHGQLHTVRLGRRWLDASGNVWRDYGDQRVELPATLPAGASLEVSDTLDAPGAAGEYQVEFDLVYEGQAWFGSRGSLTLRAPLRVR